MKKLFNSICLILSAVIMLSLFAVTSVSAEEKSGNFKYKVLSDGSAKLLEYTGEKTTLKLPEKLGGHKLSELGDYSVFDYDVKMTEVVIPKTVRKISSIAFGADTSYIKRFKVSAENKYFSADSDGVLYNKDKTVLVLYPIGKGKKITYTVAESVTEIGDDAFFGAELEKINLPSKLKKIGNSSFTGCKLKSITFPSTLESIGNYAFTDNLFKTLTFPGSLRYIGKSAFCYNEWGKKKSTLTSVTLNEGLEKIAKGAFGGTALESIHIPSTVKTIAHDAFDCSKLKSWTVAENSPYFTLGANCGLYNKSKTKLFGFPKGKKLPDDLTVPKGVKTIGKYAFYERDLTTIELPASLEEIGEHAFTESWIEHISIPSGVKKIRKYAFDNFNYLGKKELKLPASLEEIGDCAFRGASIDKLTIPSKLKKLGAGAFSETNITSVDIPKNIKKISDCCFLYCTGLKKVTLHKGLEEIGESAFQESGIEKIKLPSTLKSIGKEAFSITKLVSVKIPKKVKHIGKDAFAPDFSSTRLKKISVAKGNRYYSSKANVLYNKKKTKLLLYPPRRENKSFTTPKSVKEICCRAFCEAKLKKLTITGNVKVIRKEAFQHAIISKSLTIQNGLKKIMPSAFYDTNVGWGWKLRLPDSVRYIGANAFYSSNLAEVNIPKKLKEIKDQTFFATFLDELTIPAGVKKIGYAAFGFGVGECGSVQDPIKDFRVKGKRNSAAHKYAKKYGMKFIAI